MAVDGPAVCSFNLADDRGSAATWAVAHQPQRALGLGRGHEGPLPAYDTDAAPVSVEPVALPALGHFRVVGDQANVRGLRRAAHRRLDPRGGSTAPPRVRALY